MRGIHVAKAGWRRAAFYPQPNLSGANYTGSALAAKSVVSMFSKAYIFFQNRGPGVSRSQKKQIFRLRARVPRHDVRSTSMTRCVSG